jgi:hypothetical protein
LLGGVQVGSALVLNLAYPGNVVMVVQDFGRKEVNFTREQQAHDQGSHPEVLPISSPASHDGFALSWFGPNQKVSPADANNTKSAAAGALPNLPLTRNYG